MSIRDLLAGPPHPSEDLTLQDLANERPDGCVYPDPLAGFAARLPGDVEEHPIASVSANPFPDETAFELNRKLHAGKIPAGREGAVRAYLKDYERFLGQPLGGGQPYQVASSEQGYFCRACESPYYGGPRCPTC
jgi:hypothetical protein